MSLQVSLQASFQFPANFNLQLVPANCFFLMVEKPVTVFSVLSCHTRPGIKCAWKRYEDKQS